jgi:opine dehydrogenase
LSKIVVAGGGAGGAAAVVELVEAGHEVRYWARSDATLEPYRAQNGISYEGVLGTGLARPQSMTCDLAATLDGADAILVCLPTVAHADIATSLARIGATTPVLLNPGHTGGALEFQHIFDRLGIKSPAIAEFSTLTYVARKYAPHSVTITGVAKSVRLGALPGGERATEIGCRLFHSARPQPDVLACDLANVNMVLHAPGAVLGAAWIEATSGDFTFYVQGMTEGVARVVQALDDERRAVARAYRHELPPLVAEMQAIGTVEEKIDFATDIGRAIASGEANRRIKAPNSLTHRYYLEDFGHGLLPFIALASIASVDVPVAAALLRIGQTLLGTDFATHGRTAQRMGIAGLDRNGLLQLVRGNEHDR